MYKPKDGIVFNPEDEKDMALINELLKLRRLQQRRTDADAEYAKYQEEVFCKIESYLDEHEEEKVYVDMTTLFSKMTGAPIHKDKVLKVQKVSTSKVTWREKELHARLVSILGEQLANEIVPKNYIISSWKCFVDLMKRYDVPFKELKELLMVEFDKVNTKCLDLREERGEINLDDLRGLYSVNTSERLQLYEVKKENQREVAEEDW